MKTAIEKRQAVADTYSTIIGRNKYNQNLRDYCFKRYKDGVYYSDCRHSSISYSYQEAGLGFGILNTAGMYTSAKLTKVNVLIKNGIIQNPDVLHPGDMLLYAGNDSSRPLKIGHVEMVHHKESDGTWIICGHGSNTPSYKIMNDYCRIRYNSIAPGGWKKGLICVKRYIQDDPVTKKTYGWHFEDGGWRFYLGNENAVMQTSQWIRWKGKDYYLDKDGKMVISKYIKYHSDDLWYWCSENGSWDTSKDTSIHPATDLITI